MHRHGVVARRKNGTQVIYSIADPTMIDLCRSVCTRIASTIDEKKPSQRQFLRLLPPPKKRRAAG